VNETGLASVNAALSALQNAQTSNAATLVEVHDAVNALKALNADEVDMATVTAAIDALEALNPNDVSITTLATSAELNALQVLNPDNVPINDLVSNIDNLSTQLDSNIDNLSTQLDSKVDLLDGFNRETANESLMSTADTEYWYGGTYKTSFNSEIQSYTRNDNHTWNYTDGNLTITANKEESLLPKLYESADNGSDSQPINYNTAGSNENLSFTVDLTNIISEGVVKIRLGWNYLDGSVAYDGFEYHYREISQGESTTLEYPHQYSGPDQGIMHLYFEVDGDADLDLPNVIVTANYYSTGDGSATRTTDLIMNTVDVSAGAHYYLSNTIPTSNTSSINVALSVLDIPDYDVEFSLGAIRPDGGFDKINRSFNFDKFIPADGNRVKTFTVNANSFVAAEGDWVGELTVGDIKLFVKTPSQIEADDFRSNAATYINLAYWYGTDDQNTVVHDFTTNDSVFIQSNPLGYEFTSGRLLTVTDTLFSWNRVAML